MRVLNVFFITVTLLSIAFDMYLVHALDVQFITSTGDNLKVLFVFLDIIEITAIFSLILNNMRLKNMLKNAHRRLSVKSSLLKKAQKVISLD